MTLVDRPASQRATHPQVICTLFENDYDQGVAVLINSLVRHGFRGMFWIGYRGTLPIWTTKLSRAADGLFMVGDAFLSFEVVESELHLTHFKAEFMKSIFDRGIASQHLWYFDPDITVRCEWNFFERWIRFGVCLCQDITVGTMPSNDPIRSEWVEAARMARWGEPARWPERYYNGGFVALSVERREFLATWQAGNQLAIAGGVDPARLQHGTRANPFYSTDQDALNIAAMYSDAPLSTVGPEGMGFIAGGFLMYHSVGSTKPWRKRFLRSALAGVPPSNGDKHFLAYADGPIRLYSVGKLRRLRLVAGLASLIGRFYRRG